MIELPDKLYGENIFLDTETKDDGLAQERGPGWAFSDGGYVCGVTVVADNFRRYIPVAHAQGENEDKDRIFSWLNCVLSDSLQRKVFANAPYDVGWLKRSGVEVVGSLEDVLTNGALCDENLFKYSLDSLHKHFVKDSKLVKRYDDLEKLCEKYGFKITKKNPAASHIWKFSGEEVTPYGLDDGLLTEELFLSTRKIIEDEDLQRVHDLECRLIRPLIEMRWRGVRVDLNRAQDLLVEFSQKRDAAIEKIKLLTGISVGPTDDHSLAKALAVRGIIVGLSEKNKKPEINSNYLKTLKDEVASAVVDCRKYEHAANTFVQSMVFDSHQNGRIHSTLNSVKGERGGTVSGRFSSTDPNLQQIPKRDEDIGPKIRKMFLAEEGEELADLDFSAQEPRWTAEFAFRAKVPGGEAVANQYVSNPYTDYHQFTADIAGISRKEAKAINLGLAYGMGEAKLCHSLGLPTMFINKYGKQLEVAGPEGKALLAKYHAGAPFIKPLMNLAKKQAESRGYVTTILGRKCRFRFYQNRWLDTQKALNRVIQGSSADQTKMAMVTIWEERGVIPLLSIHDELVFSVKDRKESEYYSQVMRTCIPTTVPFIADPEFGPSLGEVA